MQNDAVVTETLKALAKFNPKSVFLYGSRGRGDATPESDYEIGVIFDDDAYVLRSDIHAAITNPDVKAYPFKWGELQQGTVGFVFQKSLYLREIIAGGRTIAGADLIGQIPLPPITILDLIQRTRFDIGMALAALLSYRSGDTKTCKEEFSKSCLFGLRSLEILELKKFPVGYDEIYRLSAGLLDDPAYQRVVEAARAVRETDEMPSIDVIFDAIGFLDSFVEPKIIAAFEEQGNAVVL